MAHVKLALKDDLLAGDLPDQEVFASRLPSYFPTTLRERFAAEIRSHQLRREIVATMLVNDVVDTAGISFAYRVAEDVGVSSVDAVRSFVAVDAIFDVGQVGIRAAGVDGVSVAVTDRMTLDLRRLIDRAALVASTTARSRWRWAPRSTGSPTRWPRRHHRCRTGCAATTGRS